MAEGKIRQMTERADVMRNQRSTDPRLVRRLEIEKALKTAGGDREDAARILGFSRATLFRKLRQHNVEPKHRRAPRREPQN